MRNSQVVILSGVATTSQTGAAFWVGQIVSASFVPVLGDVAGAGAIKIQASNDIPVGNPNQFTPTNWADIPNATSTAAAGVAPAIVIPNMCFAYVRAIFTRTGGTTTVAVNMNQLGC